MRTIQVGNDHFPLMLTTKIITKCANQKYMAPNLAAEYVRLETARRRSEDTSLSSEMKVLAVLQELNEKNVKRVLYLAMVACNPKMKRSFEYFLQTYRVEPVEILVLYAGLISDHLKISKLKKETVVK